MQKKDVYEDIDYVDFTYEIILSKGIGKLTKKAEDMIYRLGKKAINAKKNFFMQEDKDDCLQLGFYILLKKWYSFNPDKTNNAFNYLTEVFKRGIDEQLDELYQKKGISKENQANIRTISMNSINDGKGMFNIN